VILPRSRGVVGQLLLATRWWPVAREMMYCDEQCLMYSGSHFQLKRLLIKPQNILLYEFLSEINIFLTKFNLS